DEPRSLPRHGWNTIRQGARSRGSRRGDLLKLAKIIVAVDFSKASLAAARRACSLARDGSVVRLVHVLGTDIVPRQPFIGGDLVDRLFDSLEADAATELRKLAAELAGHGPVIEMHVCRGRPADRIVAEAGGHDLIVIGAHSR